MGYIRGRVWQAEQVSSIRPDGCSWWNKWYNHLRIGNRSLKIKVYVDFEAQDSFPHTNVRVRASLLWPNSELRIVAFLKPHLRLLTMRVLTVRDTQYLCCYSQLPNPAFSHLYYLLIQLQLLKSPCFVKIGLSCWALSENRYWVSQRMKTAIARSR